MVEGARSGRRPGTSVHPATRVFQAIRIAVNRNSLSLRRFLDRLERLVISRGRLRSRFSQSRIVWSNVLPKAESERLAAPAKLPVALPTATSPWVRVSRRPVTPSAAEVSAILDRAAQSFAWRRVAHDGPRWSCLRSAADLRRSGGVGRGFGAGCASPNDLPIVPPGAAPDVSSSTPGSGSGSGSDRFCPAFIDAADSTQRSTGSIRWCCAS